MGAVEESEEKSELGAVEKSELGAVEKNLLETVGKNGLRIVGDNNHYAAVIKVRVPSFRVDVSRPEDLSEEVARLWGYNRIETHFPDVPVRAGGPSARIVMREQIRDVMAGMGFSEAVNYSFTSASACDYLRLEAGDERRSVEEILNPISEELSVLRPSLLPGLLDNMRRNNSQQIDTLRLFEVGKIFMATRKGEQPKESEMAAALWSGARCPLSWHTGRVLCDFYDIKGAADALYQAMGIQGVRFVNADSVRYPYYKKGHGAMMLHNDRMIGSVGQIHDEVLNCFNLKQDAFVFEMDMELMLLLYSRNAMEKTASLPKFPSLSRDLTLILNDDIEAGAVLADVEALKVSQPLLEDVFLFDLYEGKPLDVGKKSLSMRIVYRSWEKTLREKMIRGVHAHISKIIMEKYGADLPS